MTENKSFWKNFLQPRRVGFLVAGILLLLIAYWGILYIIEATKIVPEELLPASIDKTMAAETYRFHTKSVITMDTNEKVLSDIQGEKAGSEDLHVSGNMLDTEIDVYQIGDTTYRLDSMTNKWIVIENNSIFRESLLMAELNPLSNFQFRQLISISYLGKEKIDGRKTYKIECIPQIKNQWLNSYFKNLKYIIWIDKKDKLIKKAIVTAKSKEKDTGGLQMEVNLYDYGEKIEIKPPVQPNL
ncbi:MAG: hypothetical protein ACOYI2_00330 [Bacillota bacterium]|jgi:hypothetical protein|nr:hypothetical protein [Clostridia bacterium]